MSLIEITERDHGVRIDLAYARADNVTGAPIYRRALCLLQADAAAALRRAADLARPLGFGLLVLDAFRPTEAQWILYDSAPDPTYVADPRKGSPHSRGVAVDLTLTDLDGAPLDMGGPFDDFSPRGWHADQSISAEAQQRRLLLLGLMSAAGWDFYSKEWWHYQLFNARSYPLYSDRALPLGLMGD